MTRATNPAMNYNCERDRIDVAIIDRLRESPATVRELGAAVGADLTTLSEQLRKLLARGIVRRSKITTSGPVGKAKRCLWQWRLA